MIGPIPPHSFTLFLTGTLTVLLRGHIRWDLPASPGTPHTRHPVPVMALHFLHGLLEEELIQREERKKKEEGRNRQQKRSEPRRILSG